MEGSYCGYFYIGIVNNLAFGAIYHGSIDNIYHIYVVNFVVTPVDTQEYRSVLLYSHKSWFQILQIQLAPPPDLSSDVFLHLVNSRRNCEVTLLLNTLAQRR